jgi:5-methylcytosine-specific restriction endonuclease McrA
LKVRVLPGTPVRARRRGPPPLANYIGLRCARCHKQVKELSKGQRKSVRSGWEIYCSSKCKIKNSRTGTFLKCSKCGKRIWVRKAKQKDRNYCSRSCAISEANRHRRGDKHPNYVHGRSVDYRKQAFDAHGKKCAYCGYDGHEKLLEVHHIDGDRRNWKLKNLIVLCMWHHAAITRKLAVVVRRIFRWLIQADMAP